MGEQNTKQTSQPRHRNFCAIAHTSARTKPVAGSALAQTKPDKGKYTVQRFSQRGR
ncbi:hypothetical protein ACN08Z_01470 [Rothia sp. P7181]|uniref:hypothetical protein n=1 Tax=unclassified Rothia (in: high G+C Gram-positive bacteria) TaxID=2689056 RepID=UPI003AC8D3B6